MGLSVIHNAAKTQSIHKGFRDLSYTRICHRDPQNACNYLLHSEIQRRRKSVDLVSFGLMKCHIVIKMVHDTNRSG